jgi:tetratricopeptide (TPR) repeat protein
MSKPQLFIATFCLAFFGLFTPLDPESPAFQSGDEWNIKLKQKEKPWPLGLGLTGFTAFAEEEKPEAHYSQGLKYFNEKKIEEAEKELLQAVKIDPRNEKAFCLLGIVSSMRGKNEVALSMLQEAIKLKPEYLQAHFNLATIYYQSGNLPEAIKEVETVLAYKPADSLVFRRKLGAFYTEAGRYDEAVQQYEEALKENPKDVIVQYNLGLTYLLQKKFSEAKAVASILKGLDKRLAQELEKRITEKSKEGQTQPEQ